MDRVALLIPLIVGSTAIACTIAIHGTALAATLRLVRYERTLGHAGAGFWVDLRIVATAMALALIAHLIEMGVWAVLLVLIGEFQEWGVAYYQSAMNYTSLGYGDIVMSPPWRMLGPLEATNGLLMFGVSTAMIFALIQRLVETRFPDLQS
jgi:hypothetical protein